jgi:hypothetical protein
VLGFSLTVSIALKEVSNLQLFVHSLVTALILSICFSSYIITVLLESSQFLSAN